MHAVQLAQMVGTVPHLTLKGLLLLWRPGIFLVCSAIECLADEPSLLGIVQIGILDDSLILPLRNLALLAVSAACCAFMPAHSA